MAVENNSFRSVGFVCINCLELNDNVLAIGRKSETLTLADEVDLTGGKNTVSGTNGLLPSQPLVLDVEILEKG